MSMLSQLRKPAALSLPIAAAYLPLGMALGLFVDSSGLAPYWAPIMGATIFAGSMEFVVVALLLQHQTLPAVFLTTLTVNFRHVFYGLSLPVTRLAPFPAKLYGVFALTDETYSVISSRRGRALDGGQITGLQILTQCWWVGGTALGALAGSYLPHTVGGFEFALVALFLVLSAEELLSLEHGEVLVYLVLAIVVGAAAHLLSGARVFLPVSLCSYVLFLIAHYFGRGQYE